MNNANVVENDAAASPLHPVLRLLVKKLAEVTGQPETVLRNQVSRPPNVELGDYAFPCHQYAKTRKIPPPQAAAELSEKLSADPELGPRLATVVAAGPFLNMRFKSGEIAASVLERMKAEGAAYGRGREGAGKTIVIDFSAPNIAKPFHVGHLMSTILGASLGRIYRALGYAVIGVNHLGDWGVQCGWQFLAWQQADPVEREKLLAERGLDYLAELYVGVNQQAKTDPRLEARARELFRKLEEGDAELRRLWEHLREVTLGNLQKSYDRLGVSFESSDGEGFYEPQLAPLIADMRRRGLVEESEGALVVRLDDIPNHPKIKQPFILLKADGATIYGTRDLAAVLYRKQTYAFDRCLYVVDMRQALHLSQVFATVAKMGHAWWKDCLHVNFGLMKIKEGDEVLAMSTRGGQMVPLNELLDRMVAVVRAIIEEKNPELAPEQKASVAEAVGVGAVVFWVQARRRATDTVFDWKKATDPSGDSAPYLQYTHARCRSIARKAAAECGPSVAAPDFHLLTEKEETETAHLLGRWPDILRDAARDNEPSKIASYLLDLAGCWSNFLNKHHVLKSENADLRTARLALVDSVRFVLAEGLRLLGVAAPEEM